MNCPYCGNDMERGELRSRGEMFFLPEGESTPKLYTQSEMNKHRAIYLPPYMLDVKAEFPTAYVCRACSKIIVEY